MSGWTGLGSLWAAKSSSPQHPEDNLILKIPKIRKILMPTEGMWAAKSSSPQHLEDNLILKTRKILIPQRHVIG